MLWTPSRPVVCCAPNTLQVRVQRSAGTHIMGHPLTSAGTRQLRSLTLPQLRMPPLTPPAAPQAVANDVLKDLFGSIPFPSLLALLAPHVDDLLWSIDHMGADDIKRIKASKKPARELVLHVRAHKDNAELNDAFRAAVMKRPALRSQIVGHKEPARKHMSLPLAPTSEQLQQSRELLLPSVRRSTQRSLPFPELRHPERASYLPTFGQAVADSAP